jgi:hypothetical protein
MGRLFGTVGADPEQFLTSIGQREGGDPDDELAHFYLCKACHQPVDMRDLGAVFHHEERGHEPLPWEDGERLVHITTQLREALGRERPS